MNQTANQTQTAPEGRSLIGGRNALDTLIDHAGPSFSTARFEQVVVSGDHVQVTYDAATAAGVAAALGIGGRPVSWHAERHQWAGTVAGLKVDVHGKGFLPSQVPARLMAVVTAREPEDVVLGAGSDRGSVNLLLAWLVLASVITGASAPLGVPIVVLLAAGLLGLVAFTLPAYLAQTANRGRRIASPYTVASLLEDARIRWTPGGRLDERVRRDERAAARQHRTPQVTR